MQITHSIICTTPSGAPVYSFLLENTNGSSVELTNWGARWLSAIVPDRFGLMENVLVSPHNVLTDPFYMGATVGRVANRIAGASANIEGTTYKLDRNDGANSNHGGFNGFDKQLWDWRITDYGVIFSRISPDGEGGFPGNLKVEVEYRWSELNELELIFSATTDRTTLVNLTNHVYFNLAAESSPIDSHVLQIPALNILETNQEFIPTGKLRDVRATVFDFREPQVIGDNIHAEDEQIRWNRGYNHCYVLKDKSDNEMICAARLSHPDSGRQLTLMTDQNSVLLYTAGYYDFPGTAVCLETQNWPDAPSHNNFPSCTLRSGEKYTHRTIYKFNIIGQLSTKKKMYEK